MFGKPEWFRKKKIGWGLRPISWKGWLYSLIWVLVICVPFLALVANHLLLESLVWAVVMMITLLWDVQQVMKQMHAPRPTQEADLLIIDDDTHPDSSQFATRSFDLRVRR